jgi:TRAP-type C4-dicarboxylate transport system substrate-binding protein
MIMPILTLSESQIIELVKQLPPESKRVVLLELAKESENGRESRMEYAETQLHNLCTERGLNWNTMSEDERESFIDDLVHEDRQCA